MDRHPACQSQVLTLKDMTFMVKEISWGHFRYQVVLEDF